MDHRGRLFLLERSTFDLLKPASPCRYLITAPKIWRLQTSERVMVQVMGYTEDVQVHLQLKSSLARDSTVYDQAIVTLATGSSHQQTISLQVRG